MQRTIKSLENPRLELWAALPLLVLFIFAVPSLRVAEGLGSAIGVQSCSDKGEQKDKYNIQRKFRSSNFRLY